MKIPLTPGQAVSIHGLAVRQWLTRGDVLANDKLGRRSVVSTTQQRLIQLGSQDLVPDLPIVRAAGGAGAHCRGMGMMSETLSKRCVIVSLCLHPTYPFGKETERVRECVWVSMCVG